MNPERVFDPSAYSPWLYELLKEPRLNSLRMGAPNESVRAILSAVDIQQVFDPNPVVNADMGQACLAGIWLYHDFLDESHQISQVIPNPTGSYWHAIIHRREGDFWNSKYWFRRVGEHPVFGDLHRAAARLASTAPAGDESIHFLTGQPAWDPFAFVDLCEKVVNSAGALEMLCRRIQQREWELLFDYCYRRAIGE